jgi:putative cell wall-binding protein
LLTYGSNHSLAGWSAKYGLGRVVYYGFQIYDLTAAGAYADSVTAAQARALIANSVKWAGDPALLGAAPTYGSVGKAPGISVSAGFSRGAVRVSSTVSNAGNTQLRGYFNASVLDPSGSRRGSSNLTGARIPLQPDGRYAGSWAFSVGSRPAKGRWTVRVGYEYYDFMRDGAVWMYRDVLLDSNGSSMRYAGATTWYSKNLPAAGPGILGADRYAVASSISATGWPSGPGESDAVVLATGLKFSDALAAAPLAGKLDASILLTARAGLSSYAATELKRMYAGHDGAVLYAVGSDFSMPAVVIAQARSAIEGVLASGSVRVVKLDGANDFSLAHRVAREVGAPASGPFADTAIIASYSAYADALAVSPLAAKHGIPILFVTASSVPAATQQALSEMGIKHCLIVGGPGTVSPAVEAWLETAGYRVAGRADNDLTTPDTRLSGATRYDVSVNSLKYNLTIGAMDGSEILVASGAVWPDALAAGPLGGKRSHPVLLVTSTTRRPRERGSCLGGEILPR